MMNALLDQIKALEAQSAPLNPGESERQDSLAQVNEVAQAFLNQASQMRTYSNEQVEKDLSIGTTPKSLKALLDLYQTEVTGKGIEPAAAGHLGYIPGGGIYASALADYLADVTNEYAGVHYASPGAVAVENAVLDWLKSIFGFPTSAVGNLASGGSIANLIALTAARDKHGVKNERITKSVVYLSEQVHHCIQKALRIIGLEDVVVREMPLDENFKLQPELITRQIAVDKAAGLNPFLVIASAGTTDTGVVDPLQTLGELCQQEGLWYHVDAAYGGFFVLLERCQQLFAGIELADSLVVDPHKGMFLPYGIGAVLVKDKEAVMHSNHYTANYMQDTLNEAHPVNPADVSPELTKHFRGLRIWLPIQLYGIAPFKACLEEKILLTHYFRDRLVEMGFKVGPAPDLSVSYFWYEPEHGDANAFNRQLMALLHEDGDVFLSSTLINGAFVIRMAILSFRTKLDTIERALKMIERGMNTMVEENIS